MKLQLQNQTLKQLILDESDVVGHIEVTWIDPGPQN